MAEPAFDKIAHKIRARQQQKKEAGVTDASPSDQQPIWRDKRQHERRFFHSPKGVSLEIHPQNGPVTRHTVHPLNISDGGLSYRLNKFVPPGSSCHVVMDDKHGNMLRAEGTILGCRCVEGRIHDVGVQFKEPIDSKQFCITEQDRKTAAAELAAGTATNYDTEALVALNRQLWEQAINDAPVGELRFTLQKIQALLS